MYVRRPRIKFNGLYIAKTRYLKPGETNLTYVQPVHVVVFYRYLKFYQDFSVLCMTTPDKIDRVVGKFNADNPKVIQGEWSIKGKHVYIHLL